VHRQWSTISISGPFTTNRRLFNLVADDLAIEDTMEVLAKALDYERISLDVFLKVFQYPHLLNPGNKKTGERAVLGQSFNQEDCEGDGH
jgi:Vps23 core domain